MLASIQIMYTTVFSIFGSFLHHLQHALRYDLGAFSQRRPEHLLRPARWTRGNDGRLEEGSEPSTVL